LLDNKKINNYFVIVHQVYLYIVSNYVILIVAFESVHNQNENFCLDYYLDDNNYKNI